MEAGQEQKVGSYKRHRIEQREAERALRSTPLKEALVSGTEPLQNAKDAHETAASIIKGDLKSK